MTNSIDYWMSRQRRLDCCTHNRNNSTSVSSVFPRNFHQNCSNYSNFVDGKSAVKLVDDNHNYRIAVAAAGSNNDAFEPDSWEAVDAEEWAGLEEPEYAYFATYAKRHNLVHQRTRDPQCQLEIPASSWPRACIRRLRYWAWPSWDDIEAVNVTELGERPAVRMVEECIVEDVVLDAVDMPLPR